MQFYLGKELLIRLAVPLLAVLFFCANARADSLDNAIKTRFSRWAS